VNPIRLNFQLAGNDDFAYIYGLCESTMRSYVEADLGDCFEKVARPTIQKLLQHGKFSRIYADDVLVGAVAHERLETHIQLEEIYLETARQNQGLGTQVMKYFVNQSNLGCLSCLSASMSSHQTPLDGSMSGWASR
jgi:hypothetical protein